LFAGHVANEMVEGELPYLNQNPPSMLYLSAMNGTLQIVNPEALNRMFRSCLARTLKVDVEKRPGARRTPQVRICVWCFGQEPVKPIGLPTHAFIKISEPLCMIAQLIKASCNNAKLKGVSL
jgi:hypothetical protein